MKIAVLGSTGSIGRQTLEVIRAFPSEFEVVALSANTSIDQLVEQVQLFQPKAVAIGTEDLAAELKKRLGNPGIEVMVGNQGLCRLARMPEADLVVTAIVGMIGLEPTLHAIRAGKRIALANKETLVTAGALVMSEAKKYGCPIIPIDSEHSAIHQCLAGGRRDEVDRMILTASGGPFRGKSREEMKAVSLNQALNHPNWSMGKKITIDSATMMNKGLEVIEARWLFDMPVERISVLVHPESIVHSMVEFQDGNVMAQLGPSDMRLPIQHALFYPRRHPSPWPRLDLVSQGSLTFEDLDHEAFPCYDLCMEALRRGGTYPTVLNAANESAVHAFLEGSITFLQIPAIIEEVMKNHTSQNEMVLSEILGADQWAREISQQIIERR